jgi:hypothetical protein
MSASVSIASHNKDPSIWGWGLWYADKSGACWGVGGWGKRPLANVPGLRLVRGNETALMWPWLLLLSCLCQRMAMYR